MKSAFFENKIKIIVLTGCTGAGKTELALKFGQIFIQNKSNRLCYLIKSKSDRIRSNQSLIESFADDLKINLGSASSTEESINKFKDRLSSYHGEILIINDDCSLDEIGSLVQLIIKNVYIVITLKDELIKDLDNCKDLIEKIVLKPYSEKECFEFFKINFPKANENQVKDLMRVLGILDKVLLPKVLFKAIEHTSIQCRYRKLNNYISFLTENPKELEVLIKYLND